VSYQFVFPFFVPFAWATVLFVFFFPWFALIKKYLKRPWLSALIVCIIAFFLIILPLFFLSFSLVQESIRYSEVASEWYKSGAMDKFLAPFNDRLIETKTALEQAFGITLPTPEEALKQFAMKVSSVVWGKTASIIGVIAMTVINFFTMLFTMYFFFTDGPKVVDALKRITPLSKPLTNTLFSELKSTIYASMYGGVVVAAIQGLVGGILFLLVGLPGALLWGTVMGFMSIIPIIGAVPVYGLAGIILLLSGSVGKGVTVLLVGGLVISQIDNFLRPALMAKRTTMHPLLLFFAITGGMAVFGLMGIVVGPLVAAVLLTLIKIIELKLVELKEEK
jgi:predicted PurR-regulated permease PerM